ncbi:MAG: sodium-dependent transporter [Candidatus Eisenbacteria bacterium]|jgi:SNF family Na+-dependent transporter|nr:sodium-dependent transporter [Candidatus Eisenbacteria bacterium]
MAHHDREHWGSRLGVILAVAGSAVGLGNFLRFPAKATLNGGGAFMIPYFVAFLLLGIPLMWVEWTLGRMGGIRGHGTAPGMFDALDGRHRAAKYLGTIGVLGPFVILIYYMYVESWTLAYAFFSFTGDLFKASGQDGMKAFLSGYQGIIDNEFFTSLTPALLFFALTFLANFYFIYRGVQGGIERLSRWAMPTLVVIAALLAIRVLTLGTPDANHPELSVSNALGFMWNPDLRSLGNAQVWLEAAGQIFFTLSVGIGVILTYASYLKRDDDVALSGLTAASTNEFCEVILGGSIVIPAAFLFFGAMGAREVAASGTFNLGFVTMPLIFAKIPLGALFSGLWFLLLFIAGITSSVSLIQPAISFLEDEVGMGRKKATIVLGVVSFAACLPGIFFLGHGFVDELDFWGVSVFLVVFATIEVILFAWVYGIDRAWEDLMQGARLRVPLVFKHVIKYVTPLYLFTLLGVWSYQQFWPMITMKAVAIPDRPYVWGARALVFGMWAIIALLVWWTWRRRRLEVSETKEGGTT